MEISFFALPSKQGPVQGHFKPTHLPISLSTKVTACVRRFETPTALNDGRTESKKDVPMLGSPGSVTNSHRALANGKERHLFKELKCYVIDYLGIRLQFQNEPMFACGL
jgi:hypothetical protein